MELNRKMVMNGEYIMISIAEACSRVSLQQVQRKAKRK
jgi:hypothetical protein